MWKKAAVGGAALVLAGSMVVYAQQRGGSDGPRGFDGPRDVLRMRDWRPSTQDMSAFADARIAALRAGLQLNADQEKNWPPFEQALRDLSKMRIDRLSAARDQRQQQPQQPSQQAQPANPIDRLQRRADAMTERGTALKRLADAAAPLYQSLDDAQKRRFTMLARFLRPHDHHRMMGRERRFGSQEGGYGDRGGMRHDGFHMRRFGEERGMRGSDGMGNRMGDGMGGMGGRDRMDRRENLNGMGSQDDEDYRGPL
jgi:zinc resistance-associated protein